MDKSRSFNKDASLLLFSIDDSRDLEALIHLPVQKEPF